MTQLISKMNDTVKDAVTNGNYVTILNKFINALSFYETNKGTIVKLPPPMNRYDGAYADTFNSSAAKGGLSGAAAPAPVSANQVPA